MKFVSEIDVMPLKALLDPQGKAVAMTLNNNGYEQIENVRIGKHITLEIEAESKDEAEKKVNEICTKLLHNPVMEGYQFTVSES
ncbi:MAG: phosphoribosylformylglycinamidine synthase subunit PurS [Prevotellaceae bacterium]|jgi:phosphoribosylformylglycinamidine synthase|nr:phosphoribosylformylglycinamidine synthase subunit PurS [Prevotellaceae bacterium]